MEYLTSLRKTHRQKMKLLKERFQGEYFSFSCLVYQVVCLTVYSYPTKAKEKLATTMVILMRFLFKKKKNYFISESLFHLYPI